MGISSDLAIEAHNEAMENDPEYAENYLRTEDEAAYHWAFFEQDESEIDWFSDRKLAHDGYQETECPLCNQPCTEEGDAHKACMDQEQAWADLRDEDIPF